MKTSGFFLASLFTLALGKPTTRSLKLHEALDAPPSSFSRTGPADPDQTLQLHLALPRGNAVELERKLYDISTPSSSNYGKYLSKSEVHQLVAPAQRSIDAVNAWLEENGISANQDSATGNWLSLELTVSKANELFAAEFFVFIHEDTSEEAIRTLSYSIPAELQGHLDFVHPTITFPDPSGPLPAFQIPLKSTNILESFPASVKIPLPL